MSFFLFKTKICLLFSRLVLFCSFDFENSARFFTYFYGKLLLDTFFYVILRKKCFYTEGSSDVGFVISDVGLGLNRHPKSYIRHQNGASLLLIVVVVVLILITLRLLKYCLVSIKKKPLTVCPVSSISASMRS